MADQLAAFALPPTKPLAVVTGAGGGIGRAFAVELSARGYALVLVDQDGEALQATQDALPKSASTDVCLADVAAPVAWGALVERLPRVSLLVNNAGVLAAGRLADCSADDVRRVVEVNLLGALFGCQAMAPLLAESRGQTQPLAPGVLNVASIFAPLAPPGFAAYNASKAGLIALTETLRGEWAPAGLTATVVLPGITKTGLFERGAYATEALADKVIGRGQAGVLTPEEVAVQSLEAYAAGKLVAPIGRRAARRYRLLHWLPGLVRNRVVREANRMLADG